MSQNNYVGPQSTVQSLYIITALTKTVLTKIKVLNHHIITET